MGAGDLSHPNLILDLDGVVYLGDEEIPGAGAALRKLSASGARLLFATNNASRTRTDFSGRIERVTGFEASPAQIVSSAAAAASLLAPGETCLCVGAEGLRWELTEAGGVITESWRSAEAVVVGFDEAMTYSRLRDAALALRSGARFIAANDDRTFPAPDGMWPGAGATLAFLESATGRGPDVIAGKPHAAMRSLLASRLAPGRCMVVGDRPETDLAMGREEAWTTVLVLTGVVEDVDDVPADLAPDLVLDSIADLPATLGL